MLQLMGALQVAQNKIGFTHYDLHLGNIMYTPLSTPQSITYDFRDTPGILPNDIHGYTIETRIFFASLIMDIVMLGPSQTRWNLFLQRKRQPDYRRFRQG